MLAPLKSRIKRFISSHAAPAYIPMPDPAAQKMLSLLYQRNMASGAPSKVRDTGFKVYSQTDEDGILLYLLSVIGMQTRLCVEICAGHGQECNTANLIINHGFHGLLMDGNAALVEQGKKFFASHPATYVFPPVYAQAWVTRANVNQLVESHGFRGDVDVFSLDMDGIDYWVWEALDAISPRIVVLEYADILGPDLAVTVPYKDDFNGYEFSPPGGVPIFAGASLRAYVKLAEKKGYRLVGTNTVGFNAFFVRKDISESIVPSITIEECFAHPKVVEGVRERLPTAKNLPWQHV